MLLRRSSMVSILRSYSFEIRTLCRCCRGLERVITHEMPTVRQFAQGMVRSHRILMHHHQPLLLSRARFSMCMHLPCASGSGRKRVQFACYPGSRRPPRRRTKPWHEMLSDRCEVAY